MRSMLKPPKALGIQTLAKKGPLSMRSMLKPPKALGIQTLAKKGLRSMLKPPKDIGHTKAMQTLAKKGLLSMLSMLTLVQPEALTERIAQVPAECTASLPRSLGALSRPLVGKDHPQKGPLSMLSMLKRPMSHEGSGTSCG